MTIAGTTCPLSGAAPSHDTPSTPSPEPENSGRLALPLVASTGRPWSTPTSEATWAFAGRSERDATTTSAIKSAAAIATDTKRRGWPSMLTPSRVLGRVGARPASSRPPRSAVILAPWAMRRAGPPDVGHELARLRNEPASPREVARTWPLSLIPLVGPGDPAITARGPRPKPTSSSSRLQARCNQHPSSWTHDPAHPRRPSTAAWRGRRHQRRWPRRTGPPRAMGSTR